MNKLNKAGPKMGPWGTPLLKKTQLLVTPFFLTGCLRPYKGKNLAQVHHH